MWDPNDPFTTPVERVQKMISGFIVVLIGMMFWFSDIGQESAAHGCAIVLMLMILLLSQTTKGE